MGTGRNKGKEDTHIRKQNKDREQIRDGKKDTTYIKKHKIRINWK